MLISLDQLDPVGDIHKMDSPSGHWKVSTGRPYFDLVMPDGIYPSGWVLLQGSLIRHGGDYDARLYYDLGQGFVEGQFFEIPTSGKGVINELIWLPTDIKRMKFSPMGTAGEFELGPLTLTNVGAFERRWRMARRIVSMIFLHPCKQRKLINLTFLRMLVDLQGAYKIAGKLRAHAAAPLYQNWIRQFDELTAVDRAQINEHISRFVNPPCFHLLVVSDGTEPGAVQKTLDSFNEQLYRRFTCVVLDTACTQVPSPSAPPPKTGKGGNINMLQNCVSVGALQEEGGVSANGLSENDVGRGARRVSQHHVVGWLEQFNATLADTKAGEWVLLVHAGDVLAPHTLYLFACEARAKPKAAVLYSDDDVLDTNGQRCEPRFKPDWSLAHFRSTNFVGDAVALRGDAVAKAGGVDLDCCRHGNYDLLLRVVDVVGNAGTGRVAHIPVVLLHRGAAPLPGGEGGGWRG